MKRKKKIASNQYQVVDKLLKGDYIFIHYNGYVFKANDYPYNLRDGIINRDVMIGETITVIPGKDTVDVHKRPLMAVDNTFSRGLKKYNEYMANK